MKLFLQLAGLCLLTVLNPSIAADKQPAPSKADQDPIRTRIRTVFKVEYAKTDPNATAALAGKLIDRAAEEKNDPKTRYVMLSEAIGLAVKGGDIERAVKAAREIDQDFNAPELKDILATTLAGSLAGKDRLDAFRVIANSELNKPTDVRDQVVLGQRWLEVARSIRTDSRLPAVRRARLHLCEALMSQELKGLARTEAEKSCQEAMAELDKADAKAGRFTLYEGKWVIKYGNKYTHEYVITADGSLAFDRTISPDGTPFVQKDQQKAKLVRRGGSVLVTFAGGRVVERFSLEGDRLVVERFDPASDYPKGPNNKGEGTKER